MDRRAKPAKVKVKAKRPLVRKAPPTGAARVHELEKSFAESLERESAKDRALVEALEQQTATSEILRVISSSPTDIQPVFDTIIERAVRLCDAHLGALLRFDGQMIHLAAHAHQYAESLQALQMMYPMPANTAGVSGRALLSGTSVHVRDMREDPELAEAPTAQVGHRTVLSVPMMRDGAPIGAITVARARVEPFSDRQVELLQTFADQAVIAIENVRLFTELQQRNAEVTEALEQQTASGEILRVISRAQTDVQPVFDVIARSARRLCDGMAALVFRRDGSMVHLTALDSVVGLDVQFLQVFPAPLEGTLVGRGIATGRTFHIRDIDVEGDVPPNFVAFARANGFRSIYQVPILRDGQAIGAIGVTHRAVNGFTSKQGTLLETFADQAAIAIENVRLFTELQTSNRDLTTALDTQTATSDILRVISRSQTDVQPVFDAIVENAVRLCGAVFGRVFRYDSNLVSMTAHKNFADDAGDFPRPLDNETLASRVVRTAEVVRSDDIDDDPQIPPTGRAAFRSRLVRSVAAVPMLRDGRAIGSIVVGHADVGAFSDAHVELLQTFADQAVIAIENARLLSELQARTEELTRSVGQLTALGDVGRAVSSSLDLETVLTTIVSRAVQLAAVDGGVVFEYDETAEEFVHRAATEQGGALATARRSERIRKGEGVLGQTAITLEPVQVEDISAAGAYESRLRDNLIASGIRGLLAVPMVREGQLIGSLVVSRNSAGRFAPDTVELLRTFATQSALAIQNARLFRELEIKSRELEVASQHKSEFLASMSHELRTPLNAVIGFSDVLLQGMFGETNDKQTEYLRDILASGQHLLSLINDILDLSKIEAGRMELDVEAFDLPTAIDDAMLLMRERASRRGIALERHVDGRVGEIRADQRKVKQVLLNLLSNAVKFTPEGGRIEVRAALANGAAEISVTDTGIGIAPENHHAVFEEFRQVGTADKKAEGTGLGLSLCRKFVELHGGRISLTSELGNGSTFTFALPIGVPS